MLATVIATEIAFIIQFNWVDRSAAGEDPSFIPFTARTARELALCLPVIALEVFLRGSWDTLTGAVLAVFVVDVHGSSSFRPAGPHQLSDLAQDEEEELLNHVRC